MNKLETTIAATKKKMIAKAKRKGIWETFGQKEVRDMEDKFNFLGLCFGSTEDRIEGKKIEAFRDWCENFDLSNLK